MALAQQLHFAEAFLLLGQTTESRRTGSGSHQLDDGVLFILRQPECGCQHDTSPGVKSSINSVSATQVLQESNFCLCVVLPSASLVALSIRPSLGECIRIYRVRRKRQAIFDGFYKKTGKKLLRRKMGIHITPANAGDNRLLVVAVENVVAVFRKA
jgi:hypothetical protein